MSRQLSQLFRQAARTVRHWWAQRTGTRHPYEVVDADIRLGHGRLSSIGLDAPVLGGQEEVERIALASRMSKGVAGSPLVQVVAVGDISTDVDVSVELIAAEVRQRGGRCILRVHVPQSLGKMAFWGFGSGSPTLRDDRGTAYRVILARRSSGEGGAADLDLVFEPATPSDAQVLRLSIQRMAFAISGTRESVAPGIRYLDGTWAFEIPLETPTSA